MVTYRPERGDFLFQNPVRYDWRFFVNTIGNVERFEKHQCTASLQATSQKQGEDFSVEALIERYGIHEAQNSGRLCCRPSERGK